MEKLSILLAALVVGMSAHIASADILLSDGVPYANKGAETHLQAREGEGIVYIHSAFTRATNLAGELDLWSVTELGNNTFNNCAKLEAIVASANFTKFGSQIFANATFPFATIGFRAGGSLPTRMRPLRRITTGSLR